MPKASRGSFGSTIRFPDVKKTKRRKSSTSGKGGANQGMGGSRLKSAARSYVSGGSRGSSKEAKMFRGMVGEKKKKKGRRR